MPGQAEQDHLERFVWQMTVTISCGAADRLQFRLSVPRSPALQHPIRDGVSWYTALPANTVPVLIVVAIGLQPTFCPSRDERHIPPTICALFLQLLPEGAVCCGTRTAEEFQTGAEFLPPFENSNPAAGDGEIALMRYTDTWIKMTSTKRLEYVCSLMDHGLVADSMPGEISHVDFLSAMAADYGKENLIVTSAAVALITREALAPRGQELGDTATQSEKRGRLQRVRNTSRKWSRPIGKLAARLRPEANPQPKTKAEPAVRRRPGALRAVLVATAATTAASWPKEVPLVHTQANFNRFAVKEAPEGSLQGFYTPYNEDLISMEPCTLWTKFLLKERGGALFSGPQIQACSGQQPGATNSKRAMQPLLETDLGNEVTFQRGTRMANTAWPPFDEGGLHRRHVVSSTLVDTVQTVTQRTEERAWQLLDRDGQEAATVAEAVEEVCSPPPTSQTWGHQRGAGHHPRVLGLVAGRHAANSIWQSYSLTDTVPTTDILGRVQEEQPSMTSRECVGITPCRALVKTVSRPEWTGTPTSCSDLSKEKRRWSMQGAAAAENRCAVFR